MRGKPVKDLRLKEECLGKFNLIVMHPLPSTVIALGSDLILLKEGFRPIMVTPEHGAEVLKHKESYEPEE